MSLASSVHGYQAAKEIGDRRFVLFGCATEYYMDTACGKPVHERRGTLQHDSGSIQSHGHFAALRP